MKSHSILPGYIFWWGCRGNLKLITLLGHVTAKAVVFRYVYGPIFMNFATNSSVQPRRLCGEVFCTAKPSLQQPLEWTGMDSPENPRWRHMLTFRAREDRWDCPGGRVWPSIGFCCYQRFKHEFHKSFAAFPRRKTPANRSVHAHIAADGTWCKRIIVHYIPLDNRWTIYLFSFLSVRKWQYRTIGLKSTFDNDVCHEFSFLYLETFPSPLLTGKSTPCNNHEHSFARFYFEGVENYELTLPSFRNSFQYNPASS